MAYQTNQGLPRDVAQIATTNQLGTLTDAYTASTNYRAIGGGCLITLGGALTATFFALLRYGVPTPVWISILLVVGAFLTGSLGYGMYGTRGGVSAAYLFEKGIVYRQKKLLSVLPWSQIASCEMPQGRNNGYHDRCIVRTKDGRTIPFGGLAEYEDFSASINSAI